MVEGISLFGCLKSPKKETSPDSPFLPPAEKNSATEAANIAVLKELSMTNRKRKRGGYHCYSDEVPAQIGRQAAEHDNKAAVDKFSLQLKHPVSKSWIHHCKRLYLDKLKEEGREPRFG